MFAKLSRLILPLGIIILLYAATVLGAYLLEWDMLYSVLYCTGLVFAIFVLRRVYLYRKYRRQNQTRPQQAQDAAQKRAIQNLETLWRNAIYRIKKSKLREKGNPVYVLPWYLMLGEPGCGKTRAVRNSRVSIPLLEGKALPDKDYDQGNFWLMDEAIMVDTPGRYLLPASSTDEAEWQKLKTLFKKYRRWQVVNGVVLVVPVQRLYRAREDELRNYATQIRGRLNELIVEFGVQFPVYLLISQVDGVAGMSRFFEHFSDKTLLQAMGGNTAQFAEQISVAEKTGAIMESIYDQLREMRLAVLGEVMEEDIHASTVLFPEELYALKANLQILTHALLDTGLYQEAPQYRGLYFISGEQDSVPQSLFMGEDMAGELSSAQRQGHRSLFIKGFFGTVLKHDRHLVTATRRALAFKQLKQNLGSAAWVGSCVLLAAMMTGSFFHNLSAITLASESLPADLVIKNEIDEDLQNLDIYRKAVLHLQAFNEDTYFPGTGLDHGDRLTTQLALLYANKFREAVIVPFDKSFASKLESLGDKSTALELAANVDFMTKRIALGQLVLNREQYEQPVAELLSMAIEPDYGYMLKTLHSELRDNELVPMLSQANKAYLQWIDNDRLLLADVQKEERHLSALLANEQIGMEWLNDWANLQAGIEDIHLDKYWQVAPLEDKPHYKVQRAYTPDGWALIEEFLRDIGNAVEDTELFDRKKSLYLQAYRIAYFDQWKNFLLSFDHGAEAWIGRSRKLELAARLANEDSPYRQLFAEMTEFLQPAIALLEDDSTVPPWVPLIYRHEKLMDAEYQKTLQAGDGVVAKLAKKSVKALGNLKKYVRGTDTDDAIVLIDKKAMPYLNAYYETARSMAQQVQSPQAAFVMAKETYQESVKMVGEPEQAMNRNVWSRKRLQEIVGTGTAGENVFWHAMQSQAEQLWQVLLAETEVYFDQAWQTEVIANASGLSGWQKIEELQGTDGRIWQFRDDYVAPFVQKTLRKGYVNRPLYHAQVNFNDSVLNVLNYGRVSQRAIAGSYSVQLMGLPTDVNRSARVKPHLTKLSVHCASGNIEVHNYNYPVRKLVKWTPQDCTDVFLEIHVGDLVLEKKYGGFNGFVKFLRDYRGGSKTYGIGQFEREKAQLKAYGINTVTVAYRFSGHDPVLKLALKDPSRIPDRIIARGLGGTQYAGN